MSVPYGELRAAEAWARAEFPDAESVKALWPSGVVCVEVWTRDPFTGKRSAKVVRA